MVGIVRAALRTRLADWHGRLAAATVLGAYFVLLFARGGHRAWGRLGVWALSPPFLDMHSITSAWECTDEAYPCSRSIPATR